MKKFLRCFLLIIAGSVAAMPVLAQGLSDSYRFLEAVRNHEGSKISDLLSKPGATIINTRDQNTGNGALHYMVQERNMSWLGFLIGKGAKIDIQNKEGMTPLALAAQGTWAEGVQYLLSRQASVNLANNRGETPLILAVQNRDIVIVRMLLAMGADPNRTDRIAGYSALDYAKRDNRSAAILKLLEAAKPVGPAAGPNP